jgi:hypothetical protein
MMLREMDNVKLTKALSSQKLLYPNSSPLGHDGEVVAIYTSNKLNKVV